MPACGPWTASRWPTVTVSIMREIKRAFGRTSDQTAAGMDPFGFEQLAACMAHRVSLPVGRPAVMCDRRPDPRPALGRDRSSL